MPNVTGAAIEMRSISKSYGATVALESVSLSIAPGEVQALLGENGAGKSTLVKVLSGVVKPDTGSLLLGGQPYTPATILDARHAGVTTAFQELSLVQNLSIAQNMFLPRALKGFAGLSSEKAMNLAAEEILERYGLGHLGVRASISDLPLAERQRLEIVRAMQFKPSVLILDEPTAALADVQWLFRLVRELQAQGTAILYISHRLAEIRELAQRATILRSGRSVSTVDLSEATDTDIFQMMVGHGVARSPVARAKIPVVQRNVLVVNDLEAPNVKGVSLTVGEGEIVGVAGLEGQGQRELFRLLAGDTQPTAGQITLNSKLVRLTSPRAALQAPGGIAFVPEERKVEGIFASLSSSNNITLPVLGRLSRFGLLWRRSEERAAKVPAKEVDMNERYLSFRIGNLSGGNQQKAIIARALLTGAKTLLLFDPTRGVDVGTKEAIYQAIRKHASNGGSVLVYSSELPELIALSHRCLVMYGSKIVADVPAPEMKESHLVGLLTGNAQEQEKFSVNELSESIQ
ncbi:sugar ABC transporter ATP-binding protein [Pseudomonas mohnii]